MLVFIQRLLAALIDLIIIYVPASLVAIVIFGAKIPENILGLLISIIFVAYNIVAVSSFNGKTIGKHFAKLQVVQSNDFGVVSIREGVKLLYFLPFFGGLIFMTISLICYSIKGKFLHDLIGRSEVAIHD